MTDKNGRGNATVALPEMRRGNMAICLATLLAHARPDLRPSDGHQRTSLEYRSPAAACAIAQGQLAYYRLAGGSGELTMLRSGDELEFHWAERVANSFASTNRQRCRLVTSWPWKGRTRSSRRRKSSSGSTWGCAWSVRSTTATTNMRTAPANPGRSPTKASNCLREFQRLGIILDATHLSDEGFFQALDVFGGPVIASHQNCRALVPGVRQFSDEQLRLLIERDAVIGAAFDNWMIVPNWKTGQTPRSEATLEKLADHVDHICQLAGTHRHCAIGTDLDGGYGTEQSPIEIETIADVQKFADVLARRGYPPAAIDDIFHGNWLRFFRENLAVAHAGASQLARTSRTPSNDACLALTYSDKPPRTPRSPRAFNVLRLPWRLASLAVQFVSNANHVPVIQ